MAFNKRTWLGRQGTGLNKFSIGGATPVTIVNQPDSVTQVGDALSAGNLNDLEDRIEDAFDDVDTALDTKADEQDVTNLNNAITALDHRVENLEQAKGDYIVSAYKDGSITPSGKGKWCVVEGVEGVSRVDNQLVADNKIHQTITGQNGTYVRNEFGNFNLIQGHKYLVAMIGTAPRVNGLIMTNDYSQRSEPTSASSSVLIDLTSASGIYSVWTVETQDTPYDFDIIIRDVTVYFGGTIPSDADTIAEIQTNYPHLLLPSDYGTRIVDWTGNGVRAEGVNIWDEETDTSLHPSVIGSKNFIPVIAGESYKVLYFGSLSVAVYYVYFYDSAETLISTSEITINNSFTVPNGCAYIKFRPQVTYVTTYNHDLVLCRGDAVVTTYHPYMENTLSFPSTTLKSAGSVRDTLELNVEVGGVAKKRTTQRIGSVDLGTDVSFQYDSSANRFYSTSLSATIGGETVSGRYKNTMLGSGIYELSMTGADKTYFVYASNKILYIYDNSKTASDLVSGKAPWLVGIKLYYELADPVVTLSDPIIDNTLLTEAGGRMATVQTGTVVDGISDLGFITL